MVCFQRGIGCQRQGAFVRAAAGGLLNVAVYPVLDQPIADLVDVQANLGHGAGEDVLDSCPIGRGAEPEGGEDPGAAVFGAPEVGVRAVMRGAGGAGGGLGWGWGSPASPGKEVCVGKQFSGTIGVDEV